MAREDRRRSLVLIERGLQQHQGLSLLFKCLQKLPSSYRFTLLRRLIYVDDLRDHRPLAGGEPDALGS